MIGTLDRVKKYAKEAVADSVEQRARELAKMAQTDPSIGAYVESMTFGAGDNAAFGLRIVKPSGIGDRVNVTAVAVGPESGLVCGQTSGAYNNRGEMSQAEIAMDSSMMTGLQVLRALGSTINDAKAA